MVKEIDETIDLTLECLFARENNPALVFIQHRIELARRYDFENCSLYTDDEFHKIWSKHNTSALDAIKRHIETILKDNSIDEDMETLALSLSRIFGDFEMMIEQDPYSFMFRDGVTCDCCGIGLHALNQTTNDWGLCDECEQHYENQDRRSEWDMLTAAKTVKVDLLDMQ